MREAAEILRKKMPTWGVVHVDRKLIGKFKFDQAQTIPGPRILFNQVRKGIVFDFFPFHILRINFFFSGAINAHVLFLEVARIAFEGR